MYNIGILYSYAIGPFVSVHILHMLSIFWLPETQYFLIAKHRYGDAEICLQKLRGHNCGQPELKLIGMAVNNAKMDLFSFINILKNYRIRRAFVFVIIIGLSFQQILTGNIVVANYSQRIFEELGSNLEAKYISIILAAVQVVAALASACIVDRIGRKLLLIISLFLTAICMFVVGSFFLLKNMELNVSAFTWLPIVAVMVYISATVCAASVTYAILSEIFPINLKAIGGSTFIMLCSVLAFVCVKLFQVVIDNFGSSTPFFVFAISTIGSMVFVVLMVPETKEKRLEDILKELNTN